MRRFLAVLLISISSLCALFGQPVTIDKNSPSKNEVITELLVLQKSLIVSSQKPIPEEFAKTGFLLVPMKPEFVMHLLEQKEGLIICDYQDKTLTGYIILTDTTEFKELYQDPAVGSFDTSIDKQALDTWLAKSGVGYIEQIAVKPGYSRMGIGKRLMDMAKKLKPEGLIADVFIYPVKNEPSLAFFARQGFTEPGILHQQPTANANFPYAHRTQAFFWNSP